VIQVGTRDSGLGDSGLGNSRLGNSGSWKLEADVAMTVIPRELVLLNVAAGLLVSCVLNASAVVDAPRSIGLRNAHGMVFDTVRRQVVLYGGADASRVREDTWTWNGRNWRLVTTDGPGSRTFPAMAFDEARGETVLFGGNRVLFGAGTEEPGPLLDDTWILRGNRWQRVTTPGPSARAEAAMAHDRRRRRTVLFGGYSMTIEGRVRLGDTWEWDGKRWQMLTADGPQPRNGAALAFDEMRGKVVLSGGPPAFVEPETWEWNGQSWRKSPERSPPGRYNPVMVYHAGLKALVRFGGWTGKVRSSDTWIRRGIEWHEFRGRGPSPRNHSAMAYDALRGRAVLFGGHDGEFVFGDTWEFDGKTWRQVGRAVPQRRVDNKH
jgi:galactose oxidase-like protein